MKKLDFDNYPRDFTFVVGQNNYHCNRMIADFISPTIRNMHKSDITLNNFVLSNNTNCEYNEFQTIISLGEGNGIYLDDHNLDQLSFLFDSLGNHEFSAFLEFKTETKLDIENCVDILLLKEKLHQSLTREVQYISKHFYKINENDIDRLNFDQLYEILSHPALCIESEQWLFDLIYNRFLEDKNYCGLFEFIDFRCVSVEKINDFSDSFHFSYLNAGTFKALLERIRCEIIIPKIHSKRYKMIESSHDFNGHSLDGIIKYLSNKCKGNVARKDIVSVTSSSVFSPSEEYSPSNIVDLEDNNYFFSNCGPGQWICIDFKDNLIIPNSYTLKSVTIGSNKHQPRNWSVEISLDGNTWHEVDRKEGNSILNNKNDIGVFKIDYPQKCRFIKFTLTGKTSYNTDYFALAAIEVFGKLFEY